MIITVIGHLCFDVIHHTDGRVIQSPGGIYFSVATLANLCSPNDTVFPVFGVGKHEYDSFMEQLKQYPNVDTSGIFRFPGPTNQVSLTYKDARERIECSRHIADPIPFKRIRPYLEADMILINMISGLDISLETLDEIRMEVREAHTPVYMDVHSLTLGINADFTRFHRPLEAWRRWLFMIHAAQMNEEEAAVLTAERLDEITLAKHTLALNTNALIITRGERGCEAFVDNHKHIDRHEFPGIAVREPVDPTGCGDVFAAAYCAHYAKTGDIAGSIEFANRVAAAKAGSSGSSEIEKLAAFRAEESRLEQT